MRYQVEGPCWLCQGQFDSIKVNLTLSKSIWLCQGQIDSIKVKLTLSKSNWLCQSQFDSVKVNLILSKSIRLCVMYLSQSKFTLLTSKIFLYWPLLELPEPQYKNLDLGLWTHILKSDFGLWTQACQLNIHKCNNRITSDIILLRNKWRRSR